MTHRKVLPWEGCQETFAALRARGERIVQCHGAFDLLHPGHISHLEEAARLGTVLVVSITSAPFVNKGPGRPVFSDQERAYQLAHLGIVHHVVVVPCPGAVEAIERVGPHVYCKGVEYAQPKDSTARRIEEDVAAVERVGGQVVYVGAPLHSSSKLIATHLGALEPEVREYLGTFPARQAAETLDDLQRRVAALRVLVVGELIVDRYTYCHVQGLSTKARSPSVRPYEEEDQLGGALAVARQVATWGCSTRFVSVAGTEPWLDAALAGLEPGGPALSLVRGRDYQTILKQRYAERLGARKDLVKYLSVNRYMDEVPPALSAELRQRLSEELTRADLVILCDYGHGLVTPEVQAQLEASQAFLAVNCQTNSANRGFNLITKYRRCDLFSVDEAELALACGERRSSYADRLDRLARQLRAQLGWLTLGSLGSVLWTEGGNHSCPAMTRQAMDTVGAGDAFFGAAALLGRVGADPQLSSVLSNLSGALAVSWPGNREVADGPAVIKNARYLLGSVAKEPLA